jgi:hypothetical protein
VKYFLFILASATTTAGVIVLSDARGNATIEIQALLLFLIAAVLLAGAAIIDAIDKGRRE